MTTYCVYDGLSLLDIMVEHHSKNSVSFNKHLPQALSTLPTGYFVACYYTESLTSIRITTTFSLQQFLNLLY